MNPRQDLGEFGLLPQLFDYLFWADRMILSAAAGVAEEEYYRERGISAGSIHKLLAHAMGAQIVWLGRWKGNGPPRRPDHTDFPTRQSIEAHWPKVHAQIAEFLAQQTSQILASICSFTNFDGSRAAIPLGHLMLHVVDHGTYHRGQLNTMIKQAGGKPASVWYVAYQKEHAAKVG